MDWRLGELSAGGLRERTMFRNKWFYYAAIASDLVLRFGWTLTLTPRSGISNSIGKGAAPGVGPVLAQGWRFGLIFVEMARRAMWSVLRLETEHLHNTEGFRRIDVIPLHFDRKKPPTPDGVRRARGGRGHREGEASESRGRLFMFFEVVTYIALVALLAGLAALVRPRVLDPNRGEDN